MMKFAFVSRHVPTPRQYELAQEKGIELVPVGDLDGFTGDFHALPSDLVGAVVVHAGAALRAMTALGMVGVFENANRAPEGQPPQFEAVALHLWRDGSYFGLDPGWIEQDPKYI
jgi:hypothetical protein